MIMKIESLIEIAKDCGFTVAAPLDPKTLKHLPEVREMCAADRCHSYNKSWSCPPACGSLEELETRCSAYGKGILVQTVGKLENSYDYAAMMELEQRHQKNFQDFVNRLRAEGLDIFPMGVGACRLCEKCTWPDEPCRFPDLAYPSMEACGIFVSQVCKDNGVPYYYGPNSMAFVSCCLYN